MPITIVQERPDSADAVQLIGELDAQPAPWRLHQIAKSARSAAGLAVQANKVLAEAGLKDRLHGEAMQALAQVAEFLGQSDSTLRAA